MEEKLSYKNQGVDLEGDSSTSCDNRGQIKHFPFETLMQETVLDIDLNDRSVYNSKGLKLPCASQKEVVIRHHSTPLHTIGRHRKIV